MAKKVETPISKFLKQWDNVKKIMFKQEELIGKQEVLIFKYEERINELERVLNNIAEWKLPETGKFWDDGTPMSYSAAYGSDGVRDYFKKIAYNALIKK